jgi:hypothetical protein
MGMVSKAFALAVGLSISVLGPEVAMAEIKYLLNCRLMKPTDLIYARYCIGEIHQLRLFCQDDKTCLLKTANFKSQYMKPRRKLANGSNRSDGLRAAAIQTSSKSNGSTTGPGGEPPQ